MKLAQTPQSAPFPNKLDLYFGVSWQIIGVVFMARLTIDIGNLILYPFIPQMSLGLGLTLAVFIQLVFIRSMVGTTAPIFGLLADKYGRRKLMAFGLFCEALGVAGTALATGWWAIIPMVLYGLSLAAFLSAQQAYISDQVGYEKRGRALATVEFSWAVAGILGLPVAGWMIDRFGWQSPFFLLSVISLFMAVWVWFKLPPVEHRSQAHLSVVEMWEVFLRPNVLAAVGVGALLFVTVGSFITVWGIWLNADFSLEPVALGFVATAIGVAELMGSGLSSLFIDRLGKRRGSQAGLLITSALFLLLPLTQSNLTLAIVLLVVLGVCLEFSIVSLIPLYSEQAPEARATVFSLVGLGISIGVAIASPMTTELWEKSGLGAVSIVAAVCLLGAWGLVALFLRERESAGLA